MTNTLSAPRTMALPSLKKRSAILIIEAEKTETVYNAEARATLAELLDFPLGPVTAADLPNLDAAKLSEAEIIITGWGMPVMDETFFARFPRVEIVFFAAGSARSFMTDLAWSRGVRVTTAVEVNAIPVAEFAFAEIILALKRVWAQASTVRQTRTFLREALPMPGSYRSTVGLLALGSIGRRVAAWLARTEVNVIAYDPFMAPDVAARLGVTLCSLDEIFERSDVVSCHVPWLPATQRLLRRRHFERRKRGATFINTARGAVVAEDELVEVWRARPDLFALLDVVYPEPPSQSSLLFDLPNVMLTPHIAGSMDREVERMGLEMVAEVGRYLRGETLHGELTQRQAASLA